MPGFFQEKNQISGPVVKNDDVPDKWVPWSNNRTAPALGSARQSQDAVPSFVAKNAADVDMSKFNVMPPGMELDNQSSLEVHQMPLVMSGESDVSKDTNPESFREGFKRVDMKGTDDLYTGEHTDLWYSDVGGFCERNNYLDRN
jgi:hypothetical protein